MNSEFAESERFYIVITGDRVYLLQYDDEEMVWFAESYKSYNFDTVNTLMRRS